MANDASQPTEAEIEAFTQKVLAQEIAALTQWAAYCIEIAELDNAIDRLTLEKIGKIGKQETQVFQMQKTVVPFGVGPQQFIGRRAALMLLTEKEMQRLMSPDVMTDDESQMLVWAMRNIVGWLESVKEGTQQFPHVLMAYRTFLQRAREIYILVHKHPPTIDTFPSMVMRLATARKILRETQES